MSNISRSNGDPTTKLGQLRISHEEHFFLKNHAQNVVKKLFPDLFLKSQNWAYLWINIVNFYTVCLYCILSSGLSNYTEFKLQKTFNACKAFLKTKRSSGTSLASFCHNFWREIFLLLHSINRPNFIVCLPLICEVLAICVLQLFVNQVVTS